MRFAEFNAVFNPNNEKAYFSNNEYTLTNKKRYLSFLEISTQIKSNKIEDPEICYELQEPFIIVEVKEYRIIDFIKSTSILNCHIIKAGDTYQILLRRSSDIKTLTDYTTNTLIKASIKMLTPKVKPYIILPFKSATNKSTILKNIKEVYERDLDDMDEIPFELKPIISTSFTNYTYKYPIKINTQEHLEKIILRIKGLVSSFDDMKKIISSINVLFCNQPLTPDELEELFENDAVIHKSFFEDGNVMYNNIAKYIIKKYYVKFNDADGKIYHYDEIKKVYISDEKTLKAVIGSLSPVLKTAHIDEVMEAINRMSYLNKVEFNENPLAVLFQNGVFNVGDGSFRPMSPDVLETNLIGATYKGGKDVKPNPFVDDFMKTITCGDIQVEMLLYEAIGYSMLRTSEFQVSFMLYGPGKNGKSTLFDILRLVIGRKNATNVSFKDLSNTFRPSMMENKLVSIAPDISSSDLEDSDVMKSIIAGEDVTIEQKNKDPRNKALYCTMWFGCNKLPRTSDNSYGFYRRFIVVPMKADLSKVSRGEGKKYHDKLITQENINYVANRAIRAFFNLYHGDGEFTIPKVVREETEAYRDMSDTVRQFVKYRISEGRLKRERVDDWNIDTEYPEYVEFVNRRGNRPKSQNSFELSFDAYRDELRKVVPQIKEPA